MTIVKSFLLFCVAVVSFGRVTAGQDTFRASCVKVDITPETSQWLHGYGPRKSEGVHDRIFHRIAALDDGDTSFFLVASDICTITPSFYHDVCRQLTEETGIQPGQVWWTVTHTHSAPHVGPQDLGQLFSESLGDRFSMRHDEQHWKFVADQLITGIKLAQQKLEPARIGTGIGEARANIVRRAVTPGGRVVLGGNPDGIVDRQLGLIRLERADKTLIGLVANYAIHGTVLGGNNNLISGDIQGIISEYVESFTGVPMLFVNGAEGNIGPLYSIGNDFEHPHWDAYNKLLGDKIIRLSESVQKATSDVQIVAGQTIIETPRKPGLGWLKELSDYSHVNDDGVAMIRVPVYSLSINDRAVIWGAPLELFCEMAIKVRAQSPFEQTFFFGLTNGSLLYMPTEKAISEAGYEVRTSPFTKQAESDLTTGVLRHLRSEKAKP